MTWESRSGRSCRKGRDRGVFEHPRTVEVETVESNEQFLFQLWGNHEKSNLWRFSVRSGAYPSSNCIMIFY